MDRPFKKWLVLPVFIVAMLGSGGCGQSAAEPEQATSKTKQEIVTTNQEATMKINLQVGEKTIKAVLYDNEAARKLWKQLPVTYPMMNLYGREMCFRMGAGSLPTKEAKDTGYRVGDISYWPPAGSLVILYKQNGEVFEQQPIGHTDEDISLFNGMPDTKITFSKAQ